MSKKNNKLSDKIMDVDMEEILEPKDLIRSGLEDDEGIVELAASIKLVGLMEPVIVRKFHANYEMIAGQRRYLAHLYLKEKTIRAIIAKVTRQEALIMRWEENEIRADVTDYDRMRFIDEMQRKSGLSQKALAEKIGKSEGFISQNLYVYRGNKDVLGALENGRIKFSVARALNKAPTEKIGKEFLQYCLDGNANAEQEGRWIAEAVNRHNTSEMKDSVPEEAKDIREYDATFHCDVCSQQDQKISMVVMKCCRPCAQAMINAGRKMKE